MNEFLIVLLFVTLPAAARALAGACSLWMGRRVPVERNAEPARGKGHASWI